MTASAPHVVPHVVVVGSGLAGYGVLRELRKLAPEARLTLVTHDDGHFYSKPALSTALAKAKVPDALITTPGEKMAAQLNLDLRAGRQAEGIDREGKVLLTTGGPIFYDKLVLALGADPVRPPIQGDAAHLAIAVNSLDHYREFREKLPDGARVLIMGAGLVGTEFANDLVTTGYRPVVVDMLGHPLAQLIPAEVGEKVRETLAGHGVEWHLGRKVVSLGKLPEGGFRGTLDDGTQIAADVLLSAVGLRPNTDLARDAGLEVERGIKVDQTGRTSDPSIFAIGDCAQYPQGLAAYVTPIMAAARAIAPSVLGTPTEIRFPTLSVQVKTTTYPIVLLPRPAHIDGQWQLADETESGLKYLFVDNEGVTRGYVLTRDRCQERTELDRMLIEPPRENVA